MSRASSCIGSCIYPLILDHAPPTLLVSCLMRTVMHSAPYMCRCCSGRDRRPCNSHRHRSGRRSISREVCVRADGKLRVRHIVSALCSGDTPWSLLKETDRVVKRVFSLSTACCSNPIVIQLLTCRACGTALFLPVGPAHVRQHGIFGAPPLDCGNPHCGEPTQTHEHKAVIDRVWRKGSR